MNNDIKEALGRYMLITAFMKENAPMLLYLWQSYLRGANEMGRPIPAEDRLRALVALMNMALDEIELTIKHAQSL